MGRRQMPTLYTLNYRFIDIQSNPIQETKLLKLKPCGLDGLLLASDNNDIDRTG
jgi:hypothetical protein